MELPEELKETFAQLEAQGWNPQLCDTPVPYFDAGLPCGTPREVYEATPDGYILVPRSLVGNDATVIARVTGDSMCDAGIEEGDQVHVLLDTPVYDGDIVVACIDGECTVKAYLKDKDGTVWLVPCNKAYRPIRITEEMNAHIVGKVISHRKPAPRASFGEMQRMVNSAMAQMEPDDRGYSDEDISRMLREVFDPKEMKASDWIAVYRVLCDKCGAPTSFKGFADYINALGLDELAPCKAESLRKADPLYLSRPAQWMAKADASARTTLIAKRLAIAEKLARLLQA